MLGVQQRQRSICIVVHVYIALMLVVDVVSKESPLRELFCLFFFFLLFTTAADVDDEQTNTITLSLDLFLSLSLSLPSLFSFLGLSLFLSFVFFLFACAYVYIYVCMYVCNGAHEPMTMYILQQQQKCRSREEEKKRGKERNRCNDYYCFTVLFYFFPFFVLSLSLCILILLLVCICMCSPYDGVAADIVVIVKRRKRWAACTYASSRKHIRTLCVNVIVKKAITYWSEIGARSKERKNDFLRFFSSSVYAQIGDNVMFASIFFPFITEHINDRPRIFPLSIEWLSVMHDANVQTQIELIFFHFVSMYRLMITSGIAGHNVCSHQWLFLFVLSICLLMRTMNDNVDLGHSFVL